MVTINGVDLDFDILDADVLERYETALQKMNETINENAEGESNADAIRRQCRAVFAFFDTTFAPGTAKSVFGNKTNLGVCLDAFEQVVEAYQAQNEQLNQRVKKYAPNRAARRAR